MAHCNVHRLRHTARTFLAPVAVALALQLGLTILAAAPGDTNPHATARDILQASGVKGGLVVHLGARGKVIAQGRLYVSSLDGVVRCFEKAK